MHISDTCFVKNPNDDAVIAPDYGIRNGLIVVSDHALAVRVTRGGNYVTRSIVPEYQAELSKLFRSLPHELPGYFPEGLITGKVYSFGN